MTMKATLLASAAILALGPAVIAQGLEELGHQGAGRHHCSPDRQGRARNDD